MIRQWAAGEAHVAGTVLREAPASGTKVEGRAV